MMDIDRASVQRLLETLAQGFAGPGGVAGVVHRGEVLASTAWGYRNLETAEPMQEDTRLPLCSITKQFTCMALLEAVGAPETLDTELPHHLTGFQDPLPKVRDLCNNQSGLRDYWALTILQGAKAEQTFAKADAQRMFAQMRTSHFDPGTRYSYNNGNFRLLSDMVERASGETIDALYARHVWQPAGMQTTALTADTRHPVDGVVGYEGSDPTGYWPADNGIHWQGDAGISASLQDMLSYERWIDAGREQPDHPYSKIAVPQSFAGGKPASYGFGLQHFKIAGQAFTGHGGALRGFRAYRMYAPEARLSVVVMFNHHGDAHGAAHQIARVALGQGGTAFDVVPGPNWLGAWLCPETGLLLRLTPLRGQVQMRFGTSVETLQPTNAGTLAAGNIVVRRDGAALVMSRPSENLETRLLPVPMCDRAIPTAIAGRFTSPELDGAELHIEARGGAAYARFSGIFGPGRPEILLPAAEDIWVMQTRRSMDAPAPGDWTLRFKRDAEGHVTGLEMGCWLARHIEWHLSP